jgi:hypothetical protein
MNGNHDAVDLCNNIVLHSMILLLLDNSPALQICFLPTTVLGNVFSNPQSLRVIEDVIFSIHLSVHFLYKN